MTRTSARGAGPSPDPTSVPCPPTPPRAAPAAAPQAAKRQVLWDSFLAQGKPASSLLCAGLPTWDLKVNWTWLCP